MEKRDTAENIEFLINARKELIELEKKYNKDVNLDEKITSMDYPKDIVSSAKEIKSTKKKVIKNMKKVEILTEYEKNLRDGLKGKYNFIKHTVGNDISERFVKLLTLPFDIANEVYGEDEPIIVTTVLKAPAIVGLSALFLPFTLGYICSLCGVRLAKVLKIINENDNIKKEFMDAGIYDDVVQFVETNKDRFEYNDGARDYMYDKFVEEIVTKRGKV